MATFALVERPLWGEEEAVANDDADADEVELVVVFVGCAGIVWLKRSSRLGAFVSSDVKDE